MTKLDRAIDNEKELKELDRFYESQNISALDLFNILVEVNDHSKHTSFTHYYARSLHKTPVLQH
jgi:hypothetical protein